MRYLLLIVLIIFSSCNDSYYKPEAHIVAADKITNPFIKNSCKKYSLSVLGTGGRMMGRVEDISVSFIAYGSYNVEEARDHFLKIVRPFVSEIKESLELKPYLLYPDNPEYAAQVSITYRVENFLRPKPPLIAHVIMFNGIISYSVSDTPHTGYRTIFEETYHEALQRANCTH